VLYKNISISIKSINFRPLLINGLKFDLRLYALVTGCDPLRIYLYKDGLVRFATEVYEPANEENKFDLYKHLTNFAINKDNPNFTTEQESGSTGGHKRRIIPFLNELASSYGVDTKKLWREITDLIVKTLCSIQPMLKQNSIIQSNDPYNQGCFETLGFDVLIDENYKPYLLEINHNPSFSVAAEVDLIVKRNVLYDLFTILRINTEMKTKLLKFSVSQFNERLNTGRHIKVKDGSYKQICIEERDKFIEANLGGFEKAYPSGDKDRDLEYAKYILYAEECYKEFTGVDNYRVPRRHNTTTTVSSTNSKTLSKFSFQAGREAAKSIHRNPSFRIFRPTINSNILVNLRSSNKVSLNRDRFRLIRRRIVKK